MPPRREFLVQTAAAGLSTTVLSGIAGPAAAQAVSSTPDSTWDQGRLVHLLPTVSHERILIKASFDRPLDGTPVLEAGSTRVRGQQTAPGGEFWQFDIGELRPATTYRLAAASARGPAP